MHFQQVTNTTTAKISPLRKKPRCKESAGTNLKPVAELECQPQKLQIKRRQTKLSQYLGFSPLAHGLRRKSAPPRILSTVTTTLRLNHACRHQKTSHKRHEYREHAPQSTSSSPRVLETLHTAIPPKKPPPTAKLNINRIVSTSRTRLS